MTSQFFRLFFISVFVTAFSSAFCQENFLPGYVIQNGDTVRGFVDYRNWRQNPDAISFKQDLNGSKRFFTPLEIDGFSVRDERYVSAIVQTDVSPRLFSRTGDEGSPDPELATDTTFLQTLIWGPKSLYYYVNALGKDQYYIGSGPEYSLLTYGKYLLRVRDKEGVFENNLYRGQLIAYLNDCPEVQSSMRNMRYAQSRLEKLFRFYYDCTGQEIRFERKMEKTIVDFGMVSGISLTNLRVRGVSYLERADMSPSVDVPLSVFLEIIPARNFRKWSLYNELGYSSYKVTGTYEESTILVPSTVYTSTVGLSYIRLNNMVRFKYPVGNLFVFVNAGISNGIALSETNSLVREITTYSGERVERGEVFSEVRKHEQGYLAGLGFKHKRFSFETRMEKANGMSSFAGIATTTTRYSFLVGYRMR